MDDSCGLMALQIRTYGRYAAKNDLIVALKDESVQTQHETACIFLETKLPLLPLHCRQATAEAIMSGILSRNPVIQACFSHGSLKK
jgi:hypothetical protein